MTNNVNVAGIDFSPEDIEALKSGQQIGGSRKTGITTNGAQVFTPQASYEINQGQKNVRPRIRTAEGSQANPDGGLVTAPDMSRINSNHEAEKARIAAEQQKQDDEQRSLREFMEPSKLKGEIAYLQRTVKRLQKDLKALQEKSND